MQAIVSCDFVSRTVVLDLPDIWDLDDVKDLVLEDLGLSDFQIADLLTLSHCNSCQEDEEDTNITSIDQLCDKFDDLYVRTSARKSVCSIVQLRASIGGGLKGGKGGFGALLKRKAREKGEKPTVDFGACRDLSGRRLRHINDEIILQKWKESKDTGKEFNVNESTASGIDLWYLPTPSWAAKAKGSKIKNFEAKVSKTDLCREWMSARENRSPPEGAPSWWGCPRGQRCTFAHGEDDLRGENAEEIRNKKRKQERLNEDNELDKYLQSINGDEYDDEDGSAGGDNGTFNQRQLVLEGLKKAKASESFVETLLSNDSNETSQLPSFIELLKNDNNKNNDNAKNSQNNDDNNEKDNGKVETIDAKINEKTLLKNDDNINHISNLNSEEASNELEELPLDDYGF